MRISIRYFAALRETTGQDSEQMDVAPGADASQVRDAIVAKHPSLAGVLARSAVAVNRTYAPADQPLREGDELAFIPPLGGG